MTNLRDHIIEWLDEIGADGLFDNVYQSFFIPKEALSGWGAFRAELVPAYRHADGTYHTEPDKSVCTECSGALFGTCDIKQTQDSARCDLYQSWLAHKEAK